MLQALKALHIIFEVRNNLHVIIFFSIYYNNPQFNKECTKDSSFEFEIEGLDRLEMLQQQEHENKEVKELASQLIALYFNDVITDEEENQ